MAFERDLGYLDKFFDNLDAHAATLGGEAGARLRQLVGEERARWTEIRALLGGAPSSGGKATKAASTTAAATKPRAEAPAPKTADVAPPPAAVKPVAGLTVGSLRGR